MQLNVNGYTATVGEPDQIITHATALPVCSGVMRALIALLRATPINGAAIDVISYRDLHTAVMILYEMKMPHVVTDCARIDGWANNLTRGNMLHPEYIYPLEQLGLAIARFREHLTAPVMPCSMPFAPVTVTLDGAPADVPVHEIEMFCTPTPDANPWDFLRRVMSMQLPYEARVDALAYYAQFNIADAFDSGSQYVQAQIASLAHSRALMHEYMLIDPYLDGSGDMCTYRTPTCDTWSCECITQFPRPQPGTPTIAEYDTARANMELFACGLLGGFPWDDVIVAGGGAMRAVNRDFARRNNRAADIDLFIIAPTPETRLATYHRLIEHFDNAGARARMHVDSGKGKERVDTPVCTGTFYAVHGSVTSVYITGVPRKFQIISGEYTNAYMLLDRFDLTHLQWCYRAGRFFATPLALAAQRTQCTRIHNSARTKQDRVVKAMYCGYDVQVDARANDDLAIEELTRPAEQSMQLRVILRGFHKCYYPMPDETFTDAAEWEQFVLASIDTDSRPTVVTGNASVAADNMHLGGTFDSDYASTLYTQFRPEHITNAKQPARVRSVVMMNRHGPVRISSDACVVMRAHTGEDGITLTVKPSGEFSAWVSRTLEGVVYRMYRKTPLTKHLVNDGIMEFLIPKYAVEAQVSRGRSLLRGQRGASLDIECDIKSGDEVQIMFRVRLQMTADDRSVCLCPVRIIKYHTTSEISAGAVPDADVGATGSYTSIAYDTKL